MARSLWCEFSFNFSFIKIILVISILILTSCNGRVIYSPTCPGISTKRFSFEALYKTLNSQTASFYKYLIGCICKFLNK